ncbi:MAG: ABC transporter permease [Bacteroidota bacterium]|nr:ABC transporter permease [Bacteroidota bacterium]MDP4215007.1 ABC transporter permease [Bacteroidota bacterium]MDP4244246.1 ABC transporter permease [Bacteroidota bacterium]MDP4254089.1 ABC transporter permease [Bacteroidota bacterium]MDP4257007.1 ABC transporter permease [Bacteroidota bacterium]
MKQFLVFVRKEFYHVFRDKRTLLILFGLPIAQVLLFGFALTTEIKNAQIVVVDYSKDVATQQIITRIAASPYFSLDREVLSYADMERAFRRGKIKCAVVFPPHFNEDLLHGHKAQVQIIADASDPNTDRTLSNYLNAIIGEYQHDLNANIPVPYQIKTEITMLYNPEMNGSMNFIPGVIALVLMIACTTLTSVSIVREKEMGTMEVLLVSPFRPLYVILSKAVPYLALSLMNFTIILLLGVFLLDVPIRGNLVLLFAESLFFILSCLSFGLLISSFTSSQQTAMMISMMGMMLPTILFTGFLFPIENMPWPLQVISNIVPAKWYYSIMKTVMLKGLGITAVWKESLVLVGMTCALLAISLKSFKIRLA